MLKCNATEKCLDIQKRDKGKNCLVHNSSQKYRIEIIDLVVHQI